MVSKLDRAWQTRLLHGEADAALQLAADALPRLYEYSYGRLPDKVIVQQVVSRTLVRAVREIRSCDLACSGIWSWLLELADQELQQSGTGKDTPREVTEDTVSAPTAAVRPSSRFIYRVQTQMCLAARCHLESADQEGTRRHESVVGEVTISCPACGHEYRVSPTRLGRPTRCGACGMTFKPEATEGETDDPSDICCWYVQTANEVYGPCTAAELREKVSTGEVDVTAPVRKGESGEWTSALNADGLFAPVSRPDEGQASELPPSVVAPPIQREAPPPLAKSRRRKTPDKIARFEIRQWLGSGAFGDVYRAYDSVLDREVALKVAASAALDDDHKRPYVLREPKAAAKLRHPHIVAVHDAGFDGHLFYIAIDLISGSTLRECLAKRAIAQQEAVKLIVTLAEALDYAHRSGVLHRDVKPGNIMVDADGQAALMDFGLARIESGSDKSPKAEAGFLGTAGYMPPEQIGREYGEIGPCSDQYSLGVVLYELLCGVPPFKGPQDLLFYHTIHTEPPEPRTVKASIPRDLEAICLKMLAKRPMDRYQTCGDCAEDLRKFQAGRGTIARPLSSAERLFRWSRREPSLAVASAMCGVMLFLLVIILSVFAVTKTGDNKRLAIYTQEVDKKNAELQRTVDEKEEARLSALENQSLAYFRYGHQLCENRKTQRGLVYLAEALVLAERASATSRSETIRFALSAWLRELHSLQERLPHVIDSEQKVCCVAVQPQGELAVTGSQAKDGSSGAISIWNICDQTLLRSQSPIQTKPVVALAFAPDGQSFVTIHSVRPGKTLIRRCQKSESGWHYPDEPLWSRQNTQYTSLAFCSNTRLFLGARLQDGGQVCELDLGSNNGSDFASVNHPVLCVACSPDGKRLAVGTGNEEKETGGEILVYDLTADSSSLWAKSFAKGCVQDLEFSPDSEMLAAAVGGNLHGEVWVYDAAHGTVQGDEKSYPLRQIGKINAVRFSPDGKFILTASQDRSTRFWELSSGRLWGHAMWHGRDVRDIVFLPSGPLRYLSVSDDGSVRLWLLTSPDLAGSNRIAPIVGGAPIPGTADMAVIVATSQSDGETRILDTASLLMKENGRTQHDVLPSAIAWSPGKWGLVGLIDGRVVTVDYERELVPLETRQDSCHKILSLAISADGECAAAGSDKGEFRVWDTQGSASALALPHAPESKVYAVAFDPLTHTLSTGGSDGQLRFWNRLAQSPGAAPLSHPDAILCAAYSKDGNTLAVGFAGGAQLWQRVGTGLNWKRHAYMEAETGINRIHVWEDPPLVATGDLHGNVRFWHADTGQPIGPSLQDQGPVTLLVPLSDEELLSGTAGGMVRRISLPVKRSERAEDIVLEVEVLTGMKLGEQNAVERLDYSSWREKADKLNVTHDDE